MKHLTCFLLLTFLSPGAFAQRKGTAERHPIPWQYIKDNDILWKKRVGREISIYEKNNAALDISPGIHPDSLFANILLNGINTGYITAYDTVDSPIASKVMATDGWMYTDSARKLSEIHFNKPLSPVEIKALITCNPSDLPTESRMHLNYLNKAKQYDSGYVTSCFYPQQIIAYWIIEDWIFDRNQGVMVVRILAIAPVIYINGKKHSLFWFHYPDIRQYLANYETHVGKTIYTWDEYFESRQFSSKITHVYPNNTTIKQKDGSTYIIIEENDHAIEIQAPKRSKRSKKKSEGWTTFPE